MDHLAIMRPEWRFIDKILVGQKMIESRWYQVKAAPWDRIVAGETVYFKNAGESVAAKAVVEYIEQYADLSPALVRSLLVEYANRIGVEDDRIEPFYQQFKNKRYAILIHLKNAEPVSPFAINKSGHGLMSAWITVPSINELKNE